MDHALTVRVSEAPRDVAKHPGCFRRSDRTPPAYTFRQRFTLDVGHREEHELADLFDGVNRNNVRMGELGCGPRLAQKALAQLGVGGLGWWQQLDRDGAVEPHVARQVHNPHAAPPQLPLQRIPARYSRLEVEE